MKGWQADKKQVKVENFKDLATTRGTRWLRKANKIFFNENSIVWNVWRVEERTSSPVKAWMLEQQELFWCCLIAYFQHTVDVFVVVW